MLFREIDRIHINNHIFLFVHISTQDKSVTLNNGQTIADTQWLLGYPLGDSSHMAIQVAMDPENIYQGSFNFDPSSLYQPICQKSLRKRKQQSDNIYESTLL